MISILYKVRVSWFHDSMDCRHKQGPLSHRLHSPTTMKIHFEATSCIIQRIHTIHTIHTHTIHIRMTARWQNHRTTGPQDHKHTERPTPLKSPSSRDKQQGERRKGRKQRNIQKKLGNTQHKTQSTEEITQICMGVWTNPTMLRGNKMETTNPTE